MTRYILGIYQPDGPPPPPETLGPIMEGLQAITADMQAQGAWIFACGLTPAESATTIRVTDGAESITDSPYIEGKEHLGGFTVVEAEDLDAALAWARRMSDVTTLPIEVRAFQG